VKSKLVGVTLFAVVALALVAAPGAHAQDKAEGEKMSAKPTTMKEDMLFWMSDAESKLMQLAEAMPEDKYSWRPGEGVRSTAEVFMHVAAANFGIPSFWGVKPPVENFDFQTYEKSLTSKADIQNALKDSFAHVKKSFDSATDADLNKMVKSFLGETTERRVYLLILSHQHEHLGQMIAYARSNGVVPPWSAKQQQQEQKAEGDE